jgi:hypothetical protein
MRHVPRESGRVARSVRRVGVTLVCAGLLVAGLEARARAQDATTTAKPAPDKPVAKPVAKKKKLKAKPKSTSDATLDSKAAAARRRKIGAEPAYVVGDTDAHLINENAPPIVPFPQDSKAVKKAFAETRRDQLVDAEKAARDDKSPDRWRTVLFALRGLNERIDPEACFWRVLSFYRLGELTRARKVREGCDLPARDSVVLNAEDAAAAGIPEMSASTRDDDATDPTVPTADKAPMKPTTAPATPGTPRYTGPSPQRYE